MSQRIRGAFWPAEVITLVLAILIKSLQPHHILFEVNSRHIMHKLVFSILWQESNCVAAHVGIDGVHVDSTDRERHDLADIGHAAVNRDDLGHFMTTVHNKAVHDQFRHNLGQLGWNERELAHAEFFEENFCNLLALFICQPDEGVIVGCHRQRWVRHHDTRVQRVPASIKTVRGVRILHTLQKHAAHMAPKKLQRLKFVLLDETVDHRPIHEARIVFFSRNTALNYTLRQLHNVLLKEHERAILFARILETVLRHEALLHIYEVRC